jgi:hypothetical protein
MLVTVPHGPIFQDFGFRNRTILPFPAAFRPKRKVFGPKTLSFRHVTKDVTRADPSSGDKQGPRDPSGRYARRQRGLNGLVKCSLIELQAARMFSPGKLSRALRSLPLAHETSAPVCHHGGHNVLRGRPRSHGDDPQPRLVLVQSDQCQDDQYHGQHKHSRLVAITGHSPHLLCPSD